MNPVHAFLVFAVVGVTDVVWAHYTMAVSAKAPFRAMVAAGLIIAAGIVSIDAYIESRLYVIPAILGAMLGTFVAVSREKKRDSPVL